MPKSKKKRRKKKRSSGGGSGSISGLRGGFQGLLGQGGSKKKESLLGQALTWLLLLAVIALLIYRFAV